MAKVCDKILKVGILESKNCTCLDFLLALSIGQRLSINFFVSRLNFLTSLLSHLTLLIIAILGIVYLMSMLTIVIYI